MTLYVDTSALLKRYLDEPDSEAAESLLLSDPDLVTGRHTAVEVRRTLARGLEAKALAAARARFRSDWSLLLVVELTSSVCEVAAEIAEITGVRTLDALHLGAMYEVSEGLIPIVTFDARQARAARELGWSVVGG